MSSTKENKMISTLSDTFNLFEEEILGSFIYGKLGILKASKICDNYKFEPQNQIIYDCMKNISGEIDTESLFVDLRKINKLDDIGGVNKLTSLGRNIRFSKFESEEGLTNSLKILSSMKAFINEYKAN